VYLFCHLNEKLYGVILPLVEPDCL